MWIPVDSSAHEGIVRGSERAEPRIY